MTVLDHFPRRTGDWEPRLHRRHEIVTTGGMSGVLSNRRAARENRASIETSIPGASTPPTYSPSCETMSKFVLVPKSTTMHGGP